MTINNSFESLHQDLMKRMTKLEKLERATHILLWCLVIYLVLATIFLWLTR